MHVLTNEKLIKTRSTWGGRLMFVGFGLILISVVLTFFNPETMTYLLLGYAALFGGFIIFNIGAGISSKWRLEPRADQALERALKGLDNKHLLYNFLLPAEHVLLTPVGIMVFQVRRIRGVISCDGDRWAHKRSLLSKLRFAVEEQVGNPTRDVQQDVSTMREYVTKNLGDVDVPIEPLILFSNPSVQLTVTNPTVPVLTVKEAKPYAKDAKAYMRQAVSQGTKLDINTYNALADLFDSAEGAQEVQIEAEPEPEAAAETKTKRKKKTKQ